MSNFRVFLLMATFCLNASAQPEAEIDALTQKMAGTYFTAAHTESVDGKLTGCGLEFAALTRDFSTKKGAPVKLSGSFYLRPLPQKGLAYMVKLGGIDFQPVEAAFAPANIFVRSATGNAPKNALPLKSDNPNYALIVGAFDDDVTSILTSIVEKKEFVVGFNRKKGQLDVVATIDLTVTDTKFIDGEALRVRSGKPLDEFMACNSRLIQLAK